MSLVFACKINKKIEIKGYAVQIISQVQSDESGLRFSWKTNPQMYQQHP